jgi:monoamine oxidase
LILGTSNGDEKMSKYYDTVIVGAGISGLYCASELDVKNILILDQATRVGGRIYEAEKLVDRDGKIIHTPMGAGMIRYHDDKVIETCKSLNLKLITVEGGSKGAQQPFERINANW